MKLPLSMAYQVMVKQTACPIGHLLVESPASYWSRIKGGSNATAATAARKDASGTQPERTGRYRISEATEYTAADILRECRKLDEADFTYRMVYLGGLAGAGKLGDSARKSAEVINQIYPYYMFISTVSVLPGTKLREQMKRGTNLPSPAKKSA